MIVAPVPSFTKEDFQKLSTDALISFMSDQGVILSNLTQKILADEEIDGDALLLMKPEELQKIKVPAGAVAKIFSKIPSNFF